MSNGELPVGVFDSENQSKAAFDAAHVAGSEAMRGATSELATYRAALVREVVEASGLKRVSTDGLRYILDGVREYRPPPRASLAVADIRQFRNYLLDEDARLRKALDPVDGVGEGARVDLVRKIEHTTKSILALQR